MHDTEVDVVVAAYEASAEVEELASGDFGDGDSSGVGAAYLRIFRMLRLLKLARVLRASRIFRRWQAYFGVSFAMLALLKFALLILVTSHWLACGWVLIGRLGSAIYPNEKPDGSFFGTSWIAEAVRTDGDGWMDGWVARGGVAPRGAAARAELPPHAPPPHASTP